MRALTWTVFLAVFALGAAGGLSASTGTRLKELGRVEGVRENHLVGYGLVVGLAGTGDTSRSRATSQSVMNVLTRFGVRIPATLDINSRNVAAVMVTSTLPSFRNIGDKLDVNVASIGDARSLLGGTLIMTPLAGPNDEVYALAQGPLTVGGYRYDAYGNLLQRNHPTVGIVAGGAVVEVSTADDLVSEGGSVFVLLNEPDFTTAERVAEAIADEFGASRLRSDITAVGPDRIVFRMTDVERRNYVDTLRRIESVRVVPDSVAKVVVNERTGTVVAGGDVRLGAATVSHGDIKVSIRTDYLVSQPVLVARPGDAVRTAVVPDVTIEADESGAQSISIGDSSTVMDLVTAMNEIHATPRDVVTVLQALHRAGSLRAQLIVQ